MTEIPRPIVGRDADTEFRVRRADTFLRGADIGIAAGNVAVELLGVATPIQCVGVIGIEPDRLIVVGDGVAVVLLG